MRKTPLKAVLQLAQGLTKSGVTPEQPRLAAGMIDVVTFVVWA